MSGFTTLASWKGSSLLLRMETCMHHFLAMDLIVLGSRLGASNLPQCLHEPNTALEVSFR